MKVIGAIAVLTGLAACTPNPAANTTEGGLGGAATGAAIGCVATIPIGCVPGAAVGAAIGGGVGAAGGLASTPTAYPPPPPQAYAAPPAYTPAPAYCAGLSLRAGCRPTRQVRPTRRARPTRRPRFTARPQAVEADLRPGAVAGRNRAISRSAAARGAKPAAGRSAMAISPYLGHARRDDPDRGVPAMKQAHRDGRAAAGRRHPLPRTVRPAVSRPRPHQARRPRRPDPVRRQSAAPAARRLV